MVSILGYKTYLLLVSKVFFILYRLQLLRLFKSFEMHYFIQKLIKPGYNVIDLGANMGYYSVTFSRLVKKNGSVTAIEPVKLYQDILKINISNKKNVVLIPYALGTESKTIQMGIPSGDIYRHGLTRVIRDGEQSSAYGKTFDVEMKTPDEAFANLPAPDYIKCDIEGYEIPVIPTMAKIIEKGMPIVQIETVGDNKTIIFDFFVNLGYHCFYLSSKSLVKVNDSKEATIGDLVFIPKSKMSTLPENIFKN